MGVSDVARRPDPVQRTVSRHNDSTGHDRYWRLLHVRGRPEQAKWPHNVIGWQRLVHRKGRHRSAQILHAVGDQSSLALATTADALAGVAAATLATSAPGPSRWGSVLCNGVVQLLRSRSHMPVRLAEAPRTAVRRRPQLVLHLLRVTVVAGQGNARQRRDRWQGCCEAKSRLKSSSFRSAW